MLIAIFTALSVLTAVCTCAGTGVFEGLGWLWVLPVTLVGTFLTLAALFAVLMLVMSAAVKMDKPQERDDPFYRLVAYLLIEALIPIMGVRLHTQGLEKTPKEGRFLLVCNHLNDTDPVVLLHCFRKSRLAFISKRENDKKPIVGPFQRRLLCQPINRENDREALKTILRCIQIIKDDKASIAVFPEGYVSLDRLLHPLRSGVFKIAQKAGVPIVVCTLRNTHHIFENAKKLRPTHVHLHLLEVIPAEELKGITAVEVAQRVHSIMAADLGPELVLPEETT